MGRPWSIENIMGWRSRYEAMQRWAIRCKQCYSDGCCVSDDFVDFFLAFMVVCYHLRDSVVQTGGVRPDEIDALIQASESMRICRDICHRSKHHSISRPSIDYQWSLGREYRPWSGGASNYRHFLIAGDEKREPLAVVQLCLKFWNDLIATGQFVEPPNPFARRSSKSEPDFL